MKTTCVIKQWVARFRNDVNEQKMAVDLKTRKEKMGYLHDLLKF